MRSPHHEEKPNQHLSTSRAKIIQVAKSLEVFLKDSKFNELLSRLKKVIAALENSKPQIVIYGKYNSGKSSLINALVSEDGQEIAPVADRPLTDKITSYAYENIELIDTPGIHAPIEHEKIAKTTLANAHLLIFLVSTLGSFDELDIINEIKSVINMGKPIFIILNDKNGYLSKESNNALPEELILIQKKLADNIGPEKKANQVHYLTVNVLTGLNAKKQKAKKELKAYQLLWQRSGLDSLEKLLNRTLLTFGDRNFLEPAINELNAIIEATLAIHEKQNPSGALQILNRENRTREQLVQACRQDGVHRIKALRFQLEKAIDLSISQNEQNIEKISKPYMNEIENQLTACLKQYLPQIYGKINLNLEMANQMISNHIQQDLQLDDSESFNINKLFVDLLENKKSHELINQSILKIPDLLKPHISKNAHQIVTKISTGLSKGLGPLISIASMYFQYQNIKKMEEKQIKQQLEMEQHKIQARNSAVQLIESQMIESWYTLLDDCTKIVFQEMHQEVKGHQDLQDQLKVVIEKIYDLRKTLNDIQI
jgi:hypothetical protein